MNNSYPEHRKDRIEAQLLYITDARERRNALLTLSVLNRVIKANRSSCNGCVADCVYCLQRLDDRQLRVAELRAIDTTSLSNS